MLLQILRSIALFVNFHLSNKKQSLNRDPTVSGSGVSIAKNEKNRENLITLRSAEYSSKAIKAQKP